MFDYIRGRSLAVRVGLAAAVVAIVPVLLDFKSESLVRENGRITAYNYLSFSALIAAVAGLLYAYRRFHAAKFTGALTGAVKVALAVVVLVSLFQGVRGTGVVPARTECQAAFSLNLCRPADDGPKGS
ncbi:hypothetical protein GCM10009639_51870 [Kitasatospora putterlickiae]|uniref:Integral membrane protein n=1 Tax=Kitasatospora putterlickiae TaxID=221725 RepID=A0ABP4J147_9ACTN